MDDLPLQSAVELNAVVTVDAERALRQADELDAEREAARIRGLLHGVPMAVKDAFAMAGIRAATGAALADVYDDLYSDDVLDTERAVRRLRQLAGAGPVLELGIGTGRLALPLAAGGLRVHGIDASAAMLDRLRAKPGGADIGV